MPPRLPNGTSGKFSLVWAWFGMPGYTQPKVQDSHATFPKYLHAQNQGN